MSQTNSQNNLRNSRATEFKAPGSEASQYTRTVYTNPSKSVSNIQSNRYTTTTTTYEGVQPNLQQSIIVSEVKRDSFHERGHHKRFLGKDLDVACFLLAVEVERLYEECHLWRNKAEQYESNNLDRRHYDQHIAELTDKLNESEYIISSQAQDNERLAHEIEEYKKRMMYIQQDRDNQINQLTLTLHRYEEELLAQKEAIEHLQIFEDQCKSLRGEISKWQKIAGEKSDTIVKQKQTIEQLEGKCIVYESDFKQVNYSLEQSEQEINQWHQRCEYLEKIIKDQEGIIQKQKIWDQERKDLLLQLDLKERELQDWKNRYSGLMKSYDNLKQVELKAQELEDKIVLVTTEIENLKRQLKLKQDQNDEWKKKYTALEIQLAHFHDIEQKVQEYEYTINMMNQEIEKHRKIALQKHSEIEKVYKDLNENHEEIKRHGKKHQENESKIVNHQQEIKDLQAQLKQSQDSNKQYSAQLDKLQNVVQFQEQNLQKFEATLSQMKDEIERLNRVLDMKSKENGDWKVKCGKLETTIVNLSQFEEKCKQQEEHIGQLTQSLEDYGQHISNCENEIYELRKYQSKCFELESKLKSLNMEIERVNGELRQKLVEIEEWRQRYVNLEISFQKIKSYETKIVDYENRIILLMKEIERLNENLKLKIGQLEEMMRKYSSLEQAINQYEYQLGVLNTELDRQTEEINWLKQENDQLKSHYVSKNATEVKNQDFMLKIILLSAETEALRSRLTNKEKEVDEMRRSSLAPFRSKGVQGSQVNLKQ